MRLSEVGKWQFVRLIDVFFLGPFMMLLAVEIDGVVAPWKVVTLFFFGLTTVLVNLYFYLKIAGY
jgi:hypothetical protein